MLGFGTRLLLVVLCGFASAHPATGQGQEAESSGPNDTSCPTWNYWDSQKGKCRCGVVYAGSIVLCSDHGDHRVAVLHGYCMTPAVTGSKTLTVGTCPYNFMNYHSKSNPFYFQLPQNSSLVESAMCGDYNRAGQLCGDCWAGFSPPVFTYHPQCVNCTDSTNKWGKYLAVSLLPQTAFSLTVLVLRLRATSPALNGFILYSQLITPPPVLRMGAILVYNFRGDPYSWDMAGIQLVKALFTFHSVWNLDFFRLIYNPFCLHSKSSTLQVLALDYITTASPLIVIGLTYVLVKLYYHNWTPVVWIWKVSLQKCCTVFTRSWNLQTSLIDAFATFLLLSYIKFLSVSFTLLFPSVIMDMKQFRIRSPTYLYYAGTTEYLGREHLPYALLAVANLVIFNILPTFLLCLYPCRWFQRCLNRLNLSCQALHIFMDTFQGSYKNGMDGTRDYRYFAGGNLLLMTGVFLSLVNEMLFLEFWSTAWIILAFLVVFSICRPFQVERHNRLHIMWLALTLFFYISTMPFMQQHTEVQNFLGTISSLVTLAVPLLCIAYVSVCLITLSFKCGKSYCAAVAGIYRQWSLRKAGTSDRECLSPLLNHDEGV